MIKKSGNFRPYNEIRGTFSDNTHKEKVVRDILEIGEGFKDYVPYEVEPTAEEKNIIALTEKLADKIAGDYGGDPQPFPLDRLHLVEEDGVEKISNYESRGGIADYLYFTIIVNRSASPLQLAVVLTHEFLHLKSFKAIKRKESKGKGKIYLERSGVQIISNDNLEGIFGDLEEAIVEECVRQLYQSEFRKHPLFAKDVKEIDQIASWFNENLKRRGVPLEKRKSFFSNLYYITDRQAILDYLASDKSDEKKLGYLQGALSGKDENGGIYYSARESERFQMYNLCDAIVKKSAGRFPDRQSVFKVLTKANFSGDLMPFFSMVSKYLGPGVLRKLADNEDIN